jgi:hypothetical protein
MFGGGEARNVPICCTSSAYSGMKGVSKRVSKLFSLGEVPRFAHRIASTP